MIYVSQYSYEFVFIQSQSKSTDLKFESNSQSVLIFQILMKWAYID